MAHQLCLVQVLANGLAVSETRSLCVRSIDPLASVACISMPHVHLKGLHMFTRMFILVQTEPKRNGKTGCLGQLPATETIWGTQV